MCSTDALMLSARSMLALTDTDPQCERGSDQET